MQALFSEWTLFTWLAGFSNGSKPLCVRCTLTFLSSGMVSRGLMTESVPWQLRVDIFVTHICQKGRDDERENIKVSIKEKNSSAITRVQPKTDCAPAFKILPVFHLSVSLSLFPPVEPCCYRSARMRAFLASLHPLSALLHTHTAECCCCCCCSHTAFTHFHLFSDTHLHIHTIGQTCYYATVSYKSTRHTHIPPHSKSIFQHKAP